MKIELAEGVGFVPKITIFWNNHNRFCLVFKRILSLFVKIRTLRFLTILLTLLLTVLEGVGVHTLSSGKNVGGKIGAILGARVGGMDAERVKTAARMLPDAAPLIPVKAQSPKHTGQPGLASGRNVQPNPFADNLGQFVLPRQPCPQIIQNRLRGQSAVGAMPDKIRLRLAGF